MLPRQPAIHKDFSRVRLTWAGARRIQPSYHVKLSATKNGDVTCPVTGETVLHESLVACAVCRQRVSPAAIKAGKCHACTRLTKVRKDDPRMARVLHEHRGLDSWGRWRIAETAAIYVLVASRLSGKLLVVLNKETLDPLRVAESGPFFARWVDLPDVQRDAELR